MCDVHVNNKLSALLNPPCVPCKATRTAHACHPSTCTTHCHRATRCPFPHLNISLCAAACFPVSAKTSRVWGVVLLFPTLPPSSFSPSLLWLSFLLLFFPPALSLHILAFPPLSYPLLT